MKLPWVSRERYEEAQEHSRKLEAELDRLREILIPQLRAAPPAPTIVGLDTDLSKIQPIAGRPTLAVVMADANREAYRRAQTTGAKGIAEELAENAKKMRRVSNG